MDDKFNEQKDTLTAIKKEISLLHQQVDYLIRNEKPLELLDLDVMMNRTHKIYDLMCGVEVGSENLEANGDEEELPVGLDAIREMFGIEDKPEEDVEEEEELLEEANEEEPVEDQETPVEENEDAYFIEEVEDVSEEEPDSEDIPEEEPAPAEQDMENSHDTQSFFLNFEPVEEEPVEEKPMEEEPAKEDESSVYTTGDEIEMTIPHLDIPEEDHTEETPEASPEVPETTTEETHEEIQENAYGEEIAYEPVVIGDIEEKEDGGFELETPETLGERLQQEQDPTLADKLQHGTVNSLQSAIGINDKFLFVNELFNGSMEKYNRSIENLDDLKTLNGALIYLNELRIELQWNSSNEAYKKLLELVHRKFGA